MPYVRGPLVEGVPVTAFKDYVWGYCRFCHREVAVRRTLGRPNPYELEQHGTGTAGAFCAGGGTAPTAPRPEMTLIQEAALYAKWCRTRCTREAGKYVNPYTGKLEGAANAQGFAVEAREEGEATPRPGTPVGA